MNEIVFGDFRNFGFPLDCFVVSDTPYNQGYHYSKYTDNLEDKEYYEMLTAAFNSKKSVVISYPEETINLFGGGRFGVCEQVVCWVYNSNTAKQSRLISWWNCKPDMRKISQPYKNPKDKRIAKRIAEGKTARAYDWWEINQVKNVSKKHSHPCPIPYELAKRIILTTTQKNDLIIDPFAGIGTVLKAAKDTGRRWLGFEIDEEYHKIAIELLSQ